MLSHFSLALLTSFLGYLPVGTVNLITADTALRRGIKTALLLALGASLMELSYGFVALNFSQLLTQPQWASWWLQLATAVLLAGIGCLFWFRKPGPARKPPSRRGLGPLGKGALLGLVNPQALPFWVLVIAWFQSRHWVQLNRVTQTGFLLGIWTGRFLSLFLYAVSAVWLAARFRWLEQWMNRVIGGVLIALGIIQSIRLFL